MRRLRQYFKGGIELRPDLSSLMAFDGSVERTDVEHIPRAHDLDRDSVRDAAKQRRFSIIKSVVLGTTVQVRLPFLV